MNSANKLIICNTSKQLVILARLCKVGTRLSKITICPIYDLNRQYFNVRYAIDDQLPSVVNQSSMIPCGEELTHQLTLKCYVMAMLQFVTANLNLSSYS